MIVPIGRWVIREACAAAARWQQQGIDCGVSVNLSASQLQDPALTDVVVAALRDTRLTPSLLTLEITESVLMTSLEIAASTLNGLKQLGLRLSLDDFGTGYSSLSYLQQIAVDEVKIDRSFVRRLDAQSPDTSLLRSIIDMARILGAHTVAEGVETPEQLTVLRSLECRLGQGFLFARPQSAAAITAYLRSHAMGGRAAAGAGRQSPAPALQASV